jgi:hypothetical protein
MHGDPHEPVVSQVERVPASQRHEFPFYRRLVARDYHVIEKIEALQLCLHLHLLPHL